MSDFHIGDELFDEFASAEDEFACYRLAGRLGALARWVLSDAALGAAARLHRSLGEEGDAQLLGRPPELPRQPGACAVLLVQAPAGRFPVLRPAFALPLRWERADGPAAGSDIPPGLRAEAEAALRSLDDGGPERFANRWRLRLAVDAPDRYDLSGWSAVGGGSAWGILAAAVLTAGYEVATDPTVFASVAWGAVARRPMPVTGFPEKLAEARRLGATAVFAAFDQHDATGGEVQRLPRDGGSPDVCLRPLCLKLAARPGAIETYRGADDQFFADASRYHRLLTVLKQAAGARDYYRDQLLAPIAARCRRQLPPDWPASPRLVTFRSESTELVELAAAIHQPAAVLVLYTKETAPASEADREQLATNIQTAAGGGRRRVLFEFVASDVRPGALPADIAAFARTGPGELVVDLTPGPKMVTLTLYADMTAAGACFTYLHTDRQPNAIAIQYGTEKLIVLY